MHIRVDEYKWITRLNNKKETENTYKCFEDSECTYWKLSLIKLLWACITEKGFRWKLEETIKYALKHHDCYRGSNSSDVMLFTNTKNFDKIWSKNK